MSAMEFVKKEALRYLGYRNTMPDENTELLVDSCIVEARAAASMVHVSRIFPVSVQTREEHGQEEGWIESGCFVTRSKSLSKNLEGCEQILVFAATLGVGIDRLLTRYSKLEMSRAVVLQAVSAALIEAYCNELNAKWKDDFKKEGWYLRPRFSPGYGDFALSNQKIILQSLDAAKWTGITLTDSLLMMPSKSVTAVIGMGKNPVNCGVEGCEACEKKDCVYRR